MVRLKTMSGERWALVKNSFRRGAFESSGRPPVEVTTPGLEFGGEQ